MPGQILIADAFDTYSLTLPLFQTPSSYVMSAASFQHFLGGGALDPQPTNIFSIVPLAGAGLVPWNSFGGNHFINADCTKVGTPAAFPNPGPGIYRTFGNRYQSVIWGQWIRVNALPSPTRSVSIWRLCDGQNHTGGLSPQLYGLAHCFLSLNHPGNLSLVNGGGSTGTIGSTPPTFPVGSWHFLEAFIYLGDANGTAPLRGSFVVRLDAVTIMSSPNAQTAFFDFQGAGYNADTFTMDAESDNVANIDFGPYYVMSAPDATSMLGTSKGVQFQTLFAIGNGAAIQLNVNGAPSNVAAINGNPTGSPSAYVFTPTAGRRDQYRFPIFSGFSSLFAVCPVIIGESDGPGSRVITSVQNVAGLKTGQGHGLTNGTYNYYEDVFTGITPAQASSGQWGEELVN